MPLLEEVFRLSGIPTYTFVEPVRYDAIKVAVRTPGRSVVLEGPSGIGKTTTVARALRDAQLDDQRTVLKLSARRPSDAELISHLPEMERIGVVIIDDFHVLDDQYKEMLSHFMKVLADEGSEESKLILIGINKAGQKLVNLANDLSMRVDFFRLEANPSSKIEELIKLGESALNIEIEDKDALADRAQGSFHIAQLLCHTLCTMSKITETCPSRKIIKLPIEVVVEEVMENLARVFQEPAIMFARGSKLRPEGRAPYLHILRWLAESEDWSLDLTEALRTHPEHKGSIGQILDKGHLTKLLTHPEKKKVLSQHFHFEESTSVLSAEDPKLIFYLKNVVWPAFTRKVGYVVEVFERRYDFALSFAGADRVIAAKLAQMLGDREVEVFYDFQEQHRILAQNVEEYLAPIYRSEAQYVIPLLSPAYPTRIWTKFESDNFKERFGTNSVIPLRFKTAADGYFSDHQKYGGLLFDPGGDIDGQLAEIAEILCRKLAEDRRNPRDLSEV